MVGYVYEFSVLDLLVALIDPRVESFAIQVRMPFKSGAYCVDDEMKKIRLVFRISVLSREDHPIRWTCRDNLDSRVARVLEEMPTCAAVS